MSHPDAAPHELADLGDPHAAPEGGDMSAPVDAAPIAPEADAPVASAGEPFEPASADAFQQGDLGEGDLAVAGSSEREDRTEIDGLPRPDLDDPQVLVAAIEAILFVVEAPVTGAQLAVALQRPTSEVDDALARLAGQLDERGSGLELRSVAGGHRLFTRPILSSVVEAFLLEGQRSKLSQAALETLAVVAYRQPVTRARISAIRGVNVDGVVRTLVTRGLIVEAGSDPDTGGGVYRTTEVFLERLGLDSISELPSLAPLLPELDMLETDEL
ncbi:condensin subunit ScpB [Jatrophihabitans sp. GAS493]|uniref:SMC-Scp complex subunit ScpB n=1 Tax=Jatrophihabitans sp. GAS493 TaxID=1907575 RepID=UPI000BB6C6F8|nr:SMC-Scp complex subunit ScpB [Jatrophihabitans sp. GAS493]SOD73805.1 condensin subunit ScpB [Jatrophihabitans sp. GAS493]